MLRPEKPQDVGIMQLGINFAYVVLQVFWIGNLLRFDQRAVTCSVEWQQPYVHEAGVQVFWSGSKCPRIAPTIV